MVSDSGFSRRDLFTRLGIIGAGMAALPELSRVLFFQRDVLAHQAAQGPPPPVPQTLASHELATLAAVCARIIPTDDNGPGATEAGAHRYIDRALSGWLASSRDAYVTGLSEVDAAAQKARGRRFIDLPPVDQDAVLRDLEAGAFFGLVRLHTIQGTFCDPAYGGNTNFVGWNLIAYPGIRLAVTAADQRMSAQLTPVRRSAYDYAMFSALGAAHAH
jgi:gluconate 2-dehydrogenase gamma chain